MLWYAIGFIVVLFVFGTLSFFREVRKDDVLEQRLNGPNDQH